MAQDGPDWQRFREEMRTARLALALTLDQVRGTHSRGYISRMESGARPITRGVVERYALMTNAPTFLTAFDFLVAQDEHPDLPLGELPPMGAVLVSAEVEQSVEVGDTVKVWERRSVLPKIAHVEATSVGMHFKRIEGERRPKIRLVTTYRAEIVSQGWATQTDYHLDIRFPTGTIVAGAGPYDFTLIYEYPLPTPVFGLVSSETLPLYRVSLTLPFDADIYELNGVWPQVAEDFPDALRRGDAGVVRARRLSAGTPLPRDFLALRPALFYGFAWMPAGAARSGGSDSPA